MISPTQTAQEILKEIEIATAFRLERRLTGSSDQSFIASNNKRYPLEEFEKMKALGILIAWTNEKEFLDCCQHYKINKYGEFICNWCQNTNKEIVNRVKELTSAIDLLNKNGIK